ncbi:MAG: DNA-3-methyladenine glycosylase [Acidobacteriota bacterium]
MKIDRDFYLRENSANVARELLGKLLVVPGERGNRVSGMIVETEAYFGVTDRAAHSYGGRRTRRTETMYAVGGTVYIFFIYGMYYQFNIVTGPVDQPHAVLIRALEPVEGIEVMRSRRGEMKDKNLTSGPGKLTIAMGIDRALNGEDLLGRKVWLEEQKKIPAKNIAAGKRIGVDYAGEDAEKRWRFWLKDNDFVSKK